MSQDINLLSEEKKRGFSTVLKSFLCFIVTEQETEAAFLASAKMLQVETHQCWLPAR